MTVLIVVVIIAALLLYFPREGGAKITDENELREWSKGVRFTGASYGTGSMRRNTTAHVYVNGQKRTVDTSNRLQERYTYQTEIGISIYALTNGNEKFYVGQSVDMDKRHLQHMRDANEYGTAKQRYIHSMANVGKRPGMEQIMVCQSQSQANEMERKYIGMYGKTNTTYRS